MNQKTITESFIDWYTDTFRYGYGTGDIYFCSYLYTFLQNVEDQYDYEKLETALTPPICWFLLNILCDRDILAYGTSPRYGCLTEKGCRLANFIKDYDANSLYEVAMSPDEGYGFCYPKYCNHTDRKDKGCINPFWSKL